MQDIYMKVGPEDDFLGFNELVTALYRHLPC